MLHVVQTKYSKGITSGLYRAELDVNTMLVYYTLIFNINENTSSEKMLNNLRSIRIPY
jgi:hypothetical protein